MNRVQAVFDITVKMKEILSQENSPNERDAVIEQIQQLLEQRENLLAELKEPFTVEEKLLGKRLIILNKDIQERMERLFTTLKQEMRQVKKQKSSNKNYVNPYRNVAVMDGMYMDKKK